MPTDKMVTIHQTTAHLANNSITSYHFSMILKKTKYICAAIFLVHLSISHLLLPAIHKIDLYPFYNWDLFSFTPSEVKQFFIRIHSIDDKQLNPPQFLFSNRDLYPGKNFKLVPPQLNRFGHSLIEKQDSKINLYRTELENNLFDGHNFAVYEIVEAPINIREVLKTKTINSFQSLGKFVFQTGEK